MIISEIMWKHSKPTPISSGLKQFYITAKHLSRGYYTRATQKFPYWSELGGKSILAEKLCRFKAALIVLFLLLFQFSLYDFNVDEYTSTNYDGVLAQATEQTFVEELIASFNFCEIK